MKETILGCTPSLSLSLTMFRPRKKVPTTSTAKYTQNTASTSMRKD